VQYGKLVSQDARAVRIQRIAARKVGKRAIAAVRCRSNLSFLLRRLSSLRAVSIRVRRREQAQVERRII
jgi:hypothetical protein